jgi:hypothetical protein
MSFSVVTFVTASALATSGTVTLSYPTGTSRGTFLNAPGSYLIASQTKYYAPASFTLTLNASDITLTWLATNTLAAGTTVSVQLAQQGVDGYNDPGLGSAINVQFARSVRVFLGSPVASDDDSLFANAALTGSGAVTLITAGKTLDVPRNLIITSSGNDSGITFTVTGTDAYGVTTVETITGANAGIAAGKKAFKTITSITRSGAAAANVKIGFGDVLGLPVFLPSAGFVLKEMQDGTAPTAGTFVAGVSTAPSATTGDVRGTYDPNAACDASKAFDLILALPDPSYLGATQYGG